MASLGFLGLGIMGAAMARRLVDAGHTVTVWNRSAGPVDELVAAGAVRAASAAEALAAPVSFSMLANDEAAEATLTVEALAAGGPGRIQVNMASVSPASADRLQVVHDRAGVAYVAAPVLGRPPVAGAGKLNILAAGPATTVDAVQSYLDVLGVRTWRFGESPRVANVVKSAVNYNLIHAIQALGESIALVENHGVPPGDFVELLTSTLFGGVAYTGYGTEIAEQRYSPPGFAMALGLKDLGLAEAAAAETDLQLPTAPMLHELFEVALADPELRDYDWGALAEVTRRRMARPA